MCEVPRLMRTPKAATMGVGRFVLLEPNVQKLMLTLDEPSLEDARSHLRRVGDALAVEGLEVSHGPAILPRLAQVLEEGVSTLTATVVGNHLVDVEPGDTRERMFGVSFDIGTTTVVATLVDLRSGGVAAVASTINRQATFGADVIARMGHAMTGPEAIQQLREAVLATVNGLLDEVFEASGVDREHVYEAVVVGNATMLHLLLGIDPRSIALSPFVATFLEAQDLRAADAGFAIHPEGRVALLPSIGAYVGADIVGDVVATGLAREPQKRLLVDVGTNGEIVCGNDERVVATAAPAGPAFEGGQILCGMRATEGAIEGVVLSNGEVELQVIGGAAARGLCGSGLIDAVAQLRLAGLLKPTGLFLTDAELAGHPLGLPRPDTRRSAGLRPHRRRGAHPTRHPGAPVGEGCDRHRHRGRDARDRLLGGRPGRGPPGGLVRHLHQSRERPRAGPRACRAVDRIKAVGNTASEGAKMALMSFREREVAAELPGVIEYVELSGAADFNDLFIANLGLPELEAVR